MTANEVMQILEQDPDYLEMMRKKEEQRLRGVAEYRRAAAPIVRELMELGFAIESLPDLHKKRIDYQKALPTLLCWLPRARDRDVVWSLLRLVGVRWARPVAAPVLLHYFTADAVLGSPLTSMRWDIGSSLFAMADASMCDDLLRLVGQQQYGKDRAMLVLAVGKMKDPRVFAVLIEALADPQLVWYAVKALGRLKAPEARVHLEALLDHPNAEVRKEARHALVKIDRAKR